MRKRLYNLLLVSLSFSAIRSSLSVVRYTQARHTIGNWMLSVILWIPMHLTKHLPRIHTACIFMLFLQHCCLIFVSAFFLVYFSFFALSFFNFFFVVVVVVVAGCCVFFCCFLSLFYSIALQKLRDACIRVMCVYFFSSYFVRSFVRLLYLQRLRHHLYIMFVTIVKCAYCVSRSTTFYLWAGSRTASIM